MTLDEAIAKLEDVNEHALICKNGELTAWLRELRELRSGGWISCKERMPEDNNRVLILAENGNVYIAMHRVFGHYVVSFEYWIDDTEVTHWQPLPEPPEGGTADE